MSDLVDEKKRKRSDDNSVGVFRTQLRALRDRKGWTQQDLAEKAGVTRTAIATYEQGVAYPPLPVVERLALSLNVSLDTLVRGKKHDDSGIDDHRLHEFFRRADRLHYRTKAILMEIIEAVLLKEELERRTLIAGERDGLP